MAEPTQEANKLQTYATEQAVSVNAFIDVNIDGENVRLQITNRFKADAAQIAKTVEAQVEAWKLLRAKYPRPTIQVPAPEQTKEPERVAVDDSGKPLPEIKTMTAERLSVEMRDNRYFYKVIGKPWSKFGVTVWPETLEAAGLDVTPGHPVPDIAGWTAEYICKDDGKPSKVTRLLPKH